MNAHTDKIQENKSQSKAIGSVKNIGSQMQSLNDSSFQFVNNRPEAIAQRKLQMLAHDSPQAKQTAQLQAIVNNHAVQQFQPIQKKSNNTGLPDNLKIGVENLSGISLDNVKVNYNSDKPTQLNAHAYAQGTDIHVAPGQERHLPHEAWHVVQQAQGRVKPTMQTEQGIPVNDDAGLEQEADVMGARAIETEQYNTLGSLNMLSPTSTVQQKEGIQAGRGKLDLTVQMAREYDKTLAPHKAKLTQWLIEENNTLGISQEGTAETIKTNKKSNFSWHHILAFADLSKHGEGKTAPANHGGNLRLGPMKNRFESGDVSGGTAVDYDYLPLDENEDVVLGDYSQGIFDEIITTSNKQSLTSKLTPETHAKTPQAEKFEGNEAKAFGEWFLETQVKNKLLSKVAITEKLVGAVAGEIDRFVNEINSQFDSLLRTYKYYNKKKEVQTTSGVPMTDISEGNFSHITIKKGVPEQEIKASSVIDELLRDQKWVQRGSQGAIQDESTTYKFGIAKHEPYTTKIETAIAAIDLAGYKSAKLIEFKSNLIREFETFKESGKESDDFEQGKEDTLINALVENLKNGAASYELLWNGIGDVAVESQYVKVKESDNDWVFPVSTVSDRRDAITDTASTPDHSVVSDAWDAVFVEALKKWDNKTPLFDEGSDPKNHMYIDFDKVDESITANEQRWLIRDINQERSANRQSALPRNFLTEKMTIDNVRNAVANELSENSVDFLSSEKDKMTLSEIKEELKNSVNSHFNVFSKRLKGVEQNLQKRKLAFGADFDGFVNNTKWNVINSSKMPTNVDGSKGKKWDELGTTIQTHLYDAWLKQEKIETLISTVATSENFIKTLP